MPDTPYIAGETPSRFPCRAIYQTESAPMVSMTIPQSPWFEMWRNALRFGFHTQQLMGAGWIRMPSSRIQTQEDVTEQAADVNPDLQPQSLPSSGKPGASKQIRPRRLFTNKPRAAKATSGNPVRS